MPMAVKQWWSDYEKDPSAAVGKLTNMMIEACGLAERLPPEAFSEDDDKDVDDYIAGLVERCTSGKVRDEEEASAVTGASVFAKKDKASKKVRANFCDFWDKFVDNAPEVPDAACTCLADVPLSHWRAARFCALRLQRKGGFSPLMS